MATGGEDLISKYVDRTGFAGDTRFAIEQLNQLYTSFQKLNEVKVGLNGTDQLTKIAPLTKQAATEFDNLDVIINRVNQRVAQLNGHSKELTQQILLEAKAAKELSIAKVNEEKAALANAKAKELEAKANDKLALAKERAAKAAGGNVVSTTNLADLEKEQQLLEKKGQVISDLDKQQADIANSATAYGRANNYAAQQSNIAAKEDEELVKQRKALKKANSENNVELQGYRLQINEANKAASVQAKESLGMVGAYEKLNIQYIAAQKSAKDLAAQYGVSSIEAQLAAKEAAALDVQLKAIDKTVGQSQRNVGNYGSAFGKLLGPIRKIAYILPGIGIAGIFNLLFEGAQKLVTALIGGEKPLGVWTLNIANLNRLMTEANKKAGDEIADLKILRGAIEDVNLPMAKRLEAIKDLRAEFPKVFDNISNEILLNGKAQKSYDDLTASIIKTVRAQAARGVLGQLESQRLDVEFERAKIIGTTDAEKARIDADPNVRASNIGTAVTAKALGVSTQELQRRKDLGLKEDEKLRVDKRRLDALKKQADTIKQIDQQEKFIFDFIGAANLVSGTAKGSGGKGDKSKSGVDQFDVEKARLQALAAIRQDELKRRIDFNKEIVDNDKLFFAERITAQEQYMLDEQRLIKDQIDTEIALAELDAKKQLSQKGLTSQQQINIEKIKHSKISEINTKGNDELLRLAHDNAKTLEKIFTDEIKLIHAHTPDLAKAWEDAAKRINEKILTTTGLFLKKMEEADKRTEKYKAKLKELGKELFDELKGLSFDILEGNIDREKNAIQGKIDLLDAQKQKEIEVVNQSIASAQDKAAQIAIIEARAAAQRDQLDKRQRELDQQKAKFEKAKAIADIIENTTIAIVKTLAEYPGPQGITLAAVIGAIGAAQLARVISTPIPKYAEGTDDHGGGLAIVGDGGKKEYVVNPDGSVYETPATATLVNLPAHAAVLPDAMAFADAVIANSFRNIPVNILDSNKFSTAGLEKKIDELKNVIRNKREMHFQSPSLRDRFIRHQQDNKEWLKNNGLGHGI